MFNSKLLVITRGYVVRVEMRAGKACLSHPSTNEGNPWQMFPNMAEFHSYLAGL